MADISFPLTRDDYKAMLSPVTSILLTVVLLSEKHNQI